jgi:hypothetical protein
LGLVASHNSLSYLDVAIFFHQALLNSSLLTLLHQIGAKILSSIKVLQIKGFAHEVVWWESPTIDNMVCHVLIL